MSTTVDPQSVPLITFNDGHTIPQLGLGMWQVDSDTAQQMVSQALGIGYRHIDTAKAYGNEEGVGKGIKESGIPREEIFLTTKVWNDEHGYDATLKACEASLKRLDLDHVDLYLIHWPMPELNLFVETWKALIELRDQGKATSIGVCNFTPSTLHAIIDETGVIPVVNQIELHPGFSQKEMRQLNKSYGISTEAWSPLAQAAALQDSTIQEIAVKHNRTPGQIILRWHMQLGNIAIPKTTHPARMLENISIFDFTLTEEEINSITELDLEGGRRGPDPDNFKL